MASIWKDPRSPHLIACFTAFIGQSARQLKKATGTTDKKLARRLADELEEAGHGARTPGRIKSFLAGIPDLKARRAAYDAFDDVLRKTTGTGLVSQTTRTFVEAWLERTRGEVSAATLTKDEQTTRLLLESLDGKADLDMAAIRQQDIARFRDEQARRVSTGTANGMLKIVRVLFGAAEADGVMQRNEARFVKRLKVVGEDTARRPFTLPELKRILEACDAEWRSLVMFGFYTGARLGDLAALTWQNLDLGRNEIRYASRKTGRKVILPLAKPLREVVDQLPAGDDPKQPLHPRAYEIAVREGRTSTLSRQFAELLAAAGLTQPRTHLADPKKQGRSARRAVSEVSFHSLRHTAVSLLKTAGVSAAVAMDLAGHESPEISAHYTHIDEATKLEALNKLPVIG